MFFGTLYNPHWEITTVCDKTLSGLIRGTFFLSEIACVQELQGPGIRFFARSQPSNTTSGQWLGVDGITFFLNNIADLADEIIVIFTIYI